MNQEIKQAFKQVYLTIFITFILGSFIWIKESRDFILHAVAELVGY